MPPADATLTIGQLAKAAGVPTTTLRYYERERLLLPIGRSAAGYRLYDSESLEQVRFLRAGQSIGLLLQDLRHLLDLPRRERPGAMKRLATRRLDEARRQLETLRQREAQLQCLVGGSESPCECGERCDDFCGLVHPAGLACCA